MYMITLLVFNCINIYLISTVIIKKKQEKQQQISDIYNMHLRENLREILHKIK